MRDRGGRGARQPTRRRSRLAGASARPTPLALRPVRPRSGVARTRFCGTRSCALPSEEFAALSLQQNDQQHRPECTGKHQNHLEGSCRTAGRTMYYIGGRRDGQRQNQERTRERLDVTKQTPINTNEICKIMAVFANSFVKLTPIQTGPRRQRENRNEENREPQREFHPAIRLTLDGVNLHASPVMGKRVYVPARSHNSPMKSRARMADFLSASNRGENSPKNFAH